MTTPTDLEATVAALQADILRLQTDMTALQTAAADRDRENQRIREWLHDTRTTDPKPREARQA